MNTFRQIVFFMFLVLLQVLILNNIFFFGYLNPYVYIVFVLLMPVSARRSQVLITAFLLGLMIDMFENTGGVHIAASVLLAYLRRPILRISTRRQGQDFEEIQIHRLPLTNQLSYFALGIFVHHLALFLLENFSLQNPGTILARTLVSSIFTSVFVLLLQLWRYRKKA